MRHSTLEKENPIVQAVLRDRQKENHLEAIAYMISQDMVTAILACDEKAFVAIKEETRKALFKFALIDDSFKREIARIAGAVPEHN